MANVHDWGAAPPLAGVTRPHAAASRKAPEADERLEAQRKVLSRVLFTIAAALFLSGFIVSALWVFAAFSAFMSLVAALPRSEGTAELMEFPTPYERELLPGTFEYRQREERLWD